ncbi:hypothetical protein AB4Z29_03450 [Paenibacillus sp. 2TAB23]|uniref:hypothetical protein n=1 Tax=Paenibacillus sp. 2TAB23 TaxID=3233004 RepID=UPI003F988830
MKSQNVFIITPIGNADTSIRRATDGLIDAVLIPLLTEHGFTSDNILVSHRMSDIGSINKQIITKVLEADLAIANLTGLNANVMYELAIRHAARKPVIVICENDTRLPFDIIDERTIFYTNDMLGVVQLKNEIGKMIPAALNDDKPDNPIYRTIEGNIIKNITGIDDVQKYMLERMDKIETIVTRHFENSNHKNNREESVEYVDYKIEGKLVREYDFEDESLFEIFKPRKTESPELLSFSHILNNDKDIILNMTFAHSTNTARYIYKNFFALRLEGIIEIEKITRLS